MSASWAERGGEIVAARFDEDEVELRKARAHLGHGREIDRGILSDRGVRTAAGFHAHDARIRERGGAHQDGGVLLSVDVVGDRTHVVALAEDR